MSDHRVRPLLAAAALLMVLAGALSVTLVGGSVTPAAAYDRYVIEVNTEGFNPRECRINRGDEIQFRNVASVPIRVYKPGHGGFPDDPDWTLQPGELSGTISYTAGTTDRYYSDAGHYVTVMTPRTSNTWAVACAKEAPTPTPTPTPTATPIAPPTPTPLPKPARCWGNGCAVGINLAADGQ